MFLTFAYFFVMSYMYMAVVTGVLFLMSSFEIVLHTARLHMIEFYSKFYIGTGYPFVAFNFKDIYNAEMTRKDSGE